MERLCWVQHGREWLVGPWFGAEMPGVENRAMEMQRPGGVEYGEVRYVSLCQEVLRWVPLRSGLLGLGAESQGGV